MNNSPSLAPAQTERYVRLGWLGIVLSLAWTIVWFYGLDGRALGEPDEGRYAEVAREMVATSDWLTPRLDGFNFFDKPAMHYWGSAAAYSVFGVHEWTARLWCALMGLLAMMAIGWSGTRLFGRQTGGFAAAILGSTLLYTASAHINTLDMGVTAFLTVGMACFLVAQFDPAAEHIRGWLNAAMWAALGFAVLSKGLIGLVLPGLVLIVYMLWRHAWNMLGRLSLCHGALLVALICAPWFIAMSYTHPGFFDYFFVREHFTRFLSSIDDRQQPVWFFPVIAILGIFPWTPLLPMSMSGWSAIYARTSAQSFLWVWIAVVLVFFSLSHSKLPFYILPLFPPLALLIARAAVNLPTTALARRLGAIALLGGSFALIAQLVPVGKQASMSTDAFHYAMTGLSAACTLIALAAFAGRQFLLRGTGEDFRRTVAIHLLALVALCGWQLLLLSLQPLAVNLSAAPIARIVELGMGARTEVFTVNMSLRGLPFYLQRLVTVVADKPDDLMPGIASRPEGYLAELGQFDQRWRAGNDEIAVMPLDSLVHLQDTGLPFRELGREGNYVVITRNTQPNVVDTVKQLTMTNGLVPIEKHQSLAGRQAIFDSLAGMNHHTIRATVTCRAPPRRNLCD